MNLKHFEEYTCVYDEKDNLIEVYENNVLTCRYKYNDNSKIIREDNLPLGETITYKYNNNTLIERSYYAYNLNILQNAKYTDKFIYDKDFPNRLIAYNDEKFTYDENGKPLTFRNAKLELSNTNNLLKLDEFSFSYDKLNFRTRKKIGNKTVEFYNNNNELLMKDKNYLLIFKYQKDKVCGFRYQTNNSTHDFVYKKNFNEDVVGIYNSKNELICEYVYDFFGNHKIILKYNNLFYSFIADINPIRFRSEFYDYEIGLYYIQNNYYDSETTYYIT